MSFALNIQDAFTRVATEFKAIRTLIGGSGTATIAALTTTDKASLVAAINEVNAKPSGATTLDQLTDVVVAAPVAGHLLRHDGTEFVNVDGTTLYQPVDSDLTAIAALSTTAYGRAFLTVVNQAGLMGMLAAGTETASGILELATTAETTTGTDATRAVTPAGVSAAINALVAGAPGLLNTLDEIANALGDDPNFAATITTSLAGKQAVDPTLTALAGLTVAANQIILATGTDTFTTLTTGATGRSVLGAATAADARTELQVNSTTEIGDVSTDFVAAFNTALA